MRMFGGQEAPIPHSPTHKEMDSALRDREVRTERVINYVRAAVIVSGVVLDVVTAALRLHNVE